MVEVDYESVARTAFDRVVDKNGIDVVLIRVEPHVSYTDYVLLVTGTSDRHVATLASEVEDVMSEAGIASLGKEGVDRGHWALLDFGFLVAHVLQKEAREYYQLDTLWPEGEEIARHEGTFQDDDLDDDLDDWDDWDDPDTDDDSE